MSASSMPTFNPMSRSPSAKLTAVVDLPTPPLPDATAMMAFTPSGACAELGPPRAPAPGPARRGASPPAGARPGARSAVSATITDWTPGRARTAASAALRTGSQRGTAAESTLIEKNTLPSVTTMSDSAPLSVSGRPSGAGILARLAAISFFVGAMVGLLEAVQGPETPTYGLGGDRQ